MNNYKNIHEILRNWGKNNQKLPPHNLTLKREVLSKAPLYFDVQKRPGLPWLSMSFAALSLLVLLASSINSPIYSTKGRMALPVTPSFTESNGLSFDTSIYPRDPGGLPITDTRQFLKTYYNATIRTRNVAEKVSKIEVSVRALGGRIDMSNSGEEYGYVSFAIPAAQLGTFREEIKSLTGKKLITEQLNSENLLPQKQSIEEAKKQAEKSLAGLKNEQAELGSNHAKVIGSYTSRLNGLNQEMTLLQNEWSSASSERKAQINSRLAQIQTEKNIIQAELENENKSYQNKLAEIKNRIKNAEIVLGSIQSEDQNLLENVATVTGNISLEKVNFWEIADIYMPGPLLAWLLATAAIAAYPRHRWAFQVFV